MKRLALLVYILLALGPIASGQDGVVVTSNSSGKWGVTDVAGNEIIPFKYVRITKKFPKVLMVGQGGNPVDFKGTRWGLFTEDGQELLPVRYDWIGELENGMAIIRQGNKFGFVNGEGKMTVACRYSAVGSFNGEGLAWVNVGGKFNALDETVSGGKFGIISRDGTEILPAKYARVGTFIEERSQFAHPLYGMGIVLDEYEYVPSYDVFTSRSIDFHLSSGLDMSFGQYIVASSTEGTEFCGIFDASGKELLPAGKFAMSFRPCGDLIPVARMNNGALQANWFRTTDGSTVLPDWETVDCITPFRSGAVIVAVRNANRLVDASGQAVGQTCEIILPSAEDKLIFSLSGKCGLMGYDGKVLLEPSLNALFPLTDGLMKFIGEDGKCGFMDSSGNVVIKAQYLEAGQFRHGFAPVKEQEGWGLIDKENKKILSCRWASIMMPESADAATLWVQKTKGGQYIGIDANTDRLAFVERYEQVRNFSRDYDGVAFVFNSIGKAGCIGTDGEILIPCILDDLDMAFSAYATMLRDGKKRWSDADTERFRKKMKGASTIFDITSIIEESKWDY